MSDLLTSICSISIVLTYWIFTALMIDRTLTKKYSAVKTNLGWVIGLLCLGVASMLLMSAYNIYVPQIMMESFDLAGVVIDTLIVSSAIITTIIVSISLYKESQSSIFFVSTFFVLIGLITSDIVVNIVKLIIPVQEYFTPLYFTYQTIILIVCMLALLDITFNRLAKSMKNIIKSLKGNLQDFTFASVICTVVYIFMASYFNTQIYNITTNSQLVPRIVFLVLCITMYFVIIYGVKRTIKNIRLDDELRLAKEVQVSILPDENKLSNIAGLKIAAKMIPYSQIGGDFYDAFRLDDDKTAFIITDVAGKGIPAAMFMMRTKSFLKINMSRKKKAGNALTFANRELLKNNDLCMFYTAVVGVYNSKTSIFSYSCGGHFPPVLIRDGKAVSCEGSNDPVIGVKNYEYNEFEVLLKKDDIILLYTDGITDTLSKEGERYGKDRLMDLISKETEPEKIVSDLIEDINIFCVHGDYADDLTLLAFKVE